MRVSARTLTIALALLCLIAAPMGAAAGQATGRVRGTVVDNSGGVMPGVTVVASTSDGRILTTAVTDGAGAYALTNLPAGRVHVTFELEGFSTSSADVAVQAGVDSHLAQTLQLANRNETVVVVGSSPTV